ncbi:IclR family transcriptional regulator [Agromyces atrinae]|nr:helix-turn-helix domain-containing protein [Agromyces atrinae]RXZ87829.1 transcriptional regulator [Agromyces atrinae]
MPAIESDNAAPTLPRANNIALALEILEQVARSRTGVSANDISRALSVPRATVYRVVNSLVQDEFLLRRPDLQGFILGARVVELAHLVTVPTQPSRRESVISDLRRTTGETIHVARFDDTRIRIVDEDPARPLSDSERVASEPGVSAIGHLLLAELPRRRAATLGRLPADEIDEIAAALAVRDYTQQIGLLAPDRACMAVAVREGDGTLIGAIALSTSVARISTAVRHLAALRQAAASLAESVPSR